MGGVVAGGSVGGIGGGGRITSSSLNSPRSEFDAEAETSVSDSEPDPLAALVPDRSAEQRSSKYRDLLLAVKKPAYFELDAPDPEISPPPSAKRSATTERSSVKAVIIEATKKASTSKKMKTAVPKLQTSPQGLAIPSSDQEFASQQTEPSSTPDNTTLPLPSGYDVVASEITPPTLPLSTPFEEPVVGAHGQAIAVSAMDTTLGDEIPITAPSVGLSAMPVKQFLAILRPMIMHDPRLTYSTLKAIVEKMTAVLVFMGCPLEDWSRRVTLLLKFMNRQKFLANELPCRLTALETQRSEHELVLRPLQGEMDHLHAVLDNSNAEIVALDNKAAQLKAELAAVEDKRRGLTMSLAKHAEAVSSAESKATSARLALKELQAQKERLELMSAFPFAGILPLEEIFKDL